MQGSRVLIDCANCDFYTIAGNAARQLWRFSSIFCLVASKAYLYDYYSVTVSNLMAAVEPSLCQIIFSAAFIDHKATATTKPAQQTDCALEAHACHACFGSATVTPD